MRSASGGGRAGRLTIHAGSLAPTACGDGSGPGGAADPQPTRPTGNNRAANAAHLRRGERSHGRVLRNAVIAALLREVVVVRIGNRNRTTGKRARREASRRKTRRDYLKRSTPV